jgi:hypothetical protein
MSLALSPPPISQAEYLDLVDALALMMMNFDDDTSRHGRRMIGVGDSFSYPAMPRRVKSLEHARAVLTRHHSAHPDRVYEIRNAERGKAVRS